MKMELVWLLCIAIGVCACVGSAREEGQPPFTIVAFGASTTAPRGKTRIFADRLRDALVEHALPSRVINAGIGGNTTDMARQRFARDVLAHKPDLVLICLGINDSAWDVWKDPPANGPRIPRERYVENLAFFVRKVREQGGDVILITPQPLCWTPRMKELYGHPPYDPEDADGFNVALRDYVRALRELASRERVPLVDVFAAFEDWSAREGRPLNDLLPDGMHPNSEGHGIIADRLIPEVLRTLQPARPND